MHGKILAKTFLDPPPKQEHLPKVQAMHGSKILNSKLISVVLTAALVLAKAFLGVTETLLGAVKAKAADGGGQVVD